jgi:hypothetical protein
LKKIIFHFKDLEIGIKQNNAIDIHQVYFQNKIDDYDEPFHAKTVNLYSYNPNGNQMANHISWQPDGHRKIAVSYSNLDFNPIIMNTIDSLVWDIGIKVDRRGNIPDRCSLIS